MKFIIVCHKSTGKDIAVAVGSIDRILERSDGDGVDLIQYGGNVVKTSRHTMAALMNAIDSACNGNYAYCRVKKDKL